MAAYLIIELSSLENGNVANYAEYCRRVRPMVENHGGQYLARGGEITPIAGDWNPERMVVVEFPSVDNIRQWWDSPEYRAIKGLRESAVTARAIVVEGYGG